MSWVTLVGGIVIGVVVAIVTDARRWLWDKWWPPPPQRIEHSPHVPDVGWTLTPAYARSASALKESR